MCILKNCHRRIGQPSCYHIRGFLSEKSAHAFVKTLNTKNLSSILILDFFVMTPQDLGEKKTPQNVWVLLLRYGRVLEVQEREENKCKEDKPG